MPDMGNVFMTNTCLEATAQGALSSCRKTTVHPKRSALHLQKAHCVDPELHRWGPSPACSRQLAEHEVQMCRYAAFCRTPPGQSCMLHCWATPHGWRGAVCTRPLTGDRAARCCRLFACTSGNKRNRVDHYCLFLNSQCLAAGRGVLQEGLRHAYSVGRRLHRQCPAWLSIAPLPS